MRKHSQERGAFIPATVAVKKLDFSTLNNSRYFDSAPLTPVLPIISSSIISRRLVDIILAATDFDF